MSATISAATLGLALVVAVLLAWRRCYRAAGFLATWALADGLRLIAAPLRAGAALPYEGRAMALWVLCEVVPTAIPPMALLVAARFDAYVAGSFAVGVPLFVALSYPTIRGERVVQEWAFYYAAAYVLAIVAIVTRANPPYKPQGRIPADDKALLALSMTGLASVVVVATMGPSAWWAVTITYGCGLVGATAAALGLSEPQA